MTGSDTSANALFCNMQKVTAESMGINPVLTVATNSSGGVAAKMISPQSIVVGTSSTGLTGREGDLFPLHPAAQPPVYLHRRPDRAGPGHIFPWMIPSAVAAASAAGVTEGGALILALTGALVLVLAFAAYRVNGYPATKEKTASL